MELVDATAANSLSAANITTAALFRAIEQWRPTMLIDEADTFLRENEELRGVLNAGYRRATAYVVRNVPVGDSWEPRKFWVWGPVAIALIGNLPSTLADRSIHIRLRRKATRETIERLRLDRIGDLTEGLQRRCLRWAHDHLAQLRDADPSVPETLNDRAADNWRPLCAIAEIAEGEWPQRVRKAIAALAGTEMDDDAMGVMLLADIRQIFEADGSEKIFSETLVKALHALEERPWSEWGQQRKPMSKTQLAGLLRPFEIRSKDVRLGEEKAKGYTKDDFADAWERYLSPLPGFSAPHNETPRQATHDAVLSGSQGETPSETRNETPRQGKHDGPLRASHAETSRNGVHVSEENARTPAPHNACLGVSDQAQENISKENQRTPAPHHALATGALCCP
jgi:putative DNA primase/helicase